MAANPSMHQYEPLRVPQHWSAEEKQLILQLTDIFDDIYRRYGRLRFEDMNSAFKNRIISDEGSISEVEQTADKINWVVASGTGVSDMSLTDELYELVTGQVMITAQESIDLSIAGIELGGRNLISESDAVVSSAVNLINSYDLTEEWEVGQTYTLRIWGSINAGQTVSAFRDGGYASIGAGETFEDGELVYTFVCPAKHVSDLGDNTVLSLFNEEAGTATSADITLIKLEKGNKPTDWSPAPEDPALMADATVATGVSLTEDGLYLSGPTVELETNQLKVVSPNAERVMLDLTDDGLFVDADVMSCQNISGNVLNTFADSSIEFEGTIQGTIDNLPKYLTQETTITVPSGIYNENISIVGFIGQKLYIVLENGVVINGNILISGCSTVHLYSAARDDSKIFSHDGICLRIYYGNAYIQNIRFYGGASTTQGVVADFAKLLVVGCGFNGIPSYCVMWRLASNGWSYNNVGSSNGSYAIRAEQGSDVHVSGTLPDASNGQTSASFSQINTYGTVTSTTSASSVSSTDAVTYTSTAARRMAVRQIRYGTSTSSGGTVSWDSWSIDSYIGWAAVALRQGILQYSIQYIGYFSSKYQYKQYQDIYKSVWIFDSFAVSGKTIQTAKITIIRAATIGSSGSVTLKLYRHAYTSAPTGSSFSLTDTGQTLSLLPGQKKTLVLNSTQISLLNAGTTKGFGLTDDGYLMSCSTIAKIEMTYA